MLRVVAPALITRSRMRQRKSVSERPASSGENSTLSVYSRAHLTARTACSITCEGSIRSFFSMWMGEVAIKVCTRGLFALRTASPQRRMSDSLARDAQLLLLGHRGARALLAVAHRRVENDELLFGHVCLQCFQGSRCARGAGCACLMEHPAAVCTAPVQHQIVGMGTIP